MCKSRVPGWFPQMLSATLLRHHVSVCFSFFFRFDVCFDFSFLLLVCFCFATGPGVFSSLHHLDRRFPVWMLFLLGFFWH